MLDHNGPGHFGSSFALGFSEPNFVKKTTHPHQGRGPRRVQGAAILVGKEIPWAAQAALGASGYVTVEDLADRGMGRTGSMSRQAMRLLQAVRVAASLVRGGNQARQNTS